jgi:hypothetical protein
MKTLLGIIVGLVLLSLTSCVKHKQTPTSDPIVESKFKNLDDKLETEGAYISVYTYGNDTLYVVESKSSSTPVAVSVK